MGKKSSDAASKKDSLEGKESFPIGVGVVDGGVSKPKNAAKKKKKEQAFSQFITDVLPSLKKEMIRKKKEAFDWDDYSKYFRPDSGYVATFMLPLFRFLLTDEIICDRYGNFDNKHRVKTAVGHKRVMDLSENSDVLELTPEMIHYFNKRFGVEWFKIPSKDGFRAKAAAAAGYDGQFKVILTGLYEDSFTDNATGKEVITINPTLMYEPVLPPPPKKERKQPSAASSSTAKRTKITASTSYPVSSPKEISSAQEVEIEPLPEYESDTLSDNSSK